MNGLMTAGCSVKDYQKDTHNCLVCRWILDDINNEELSNSLYTFYWKSYNTYIGYIARSTWHFLF